MTVHIIRGPSGCGKSTFAEKLQEELLQETHGELIISPQIISADDWFTTKDGEYKFDPRFLSRAHTETITNAMSALKMGRHVIIANTFTNYWEVSPYLWMAQLADVQCIVYEPDILLENKDGIWDMKQMLFLEEMHKRCTHGVPLDKIEIHMMNFHHLEESKLVSKVEQFDTGLL